MFLLRATALSVTEICAEVGFTSLGTFSKTFRDVVGETPSAYRSRSRAEGAWRPRVAAGAVGVPTCFAMRWTRPSSFTAPLEQESNFEEAGAPAAP